MLADPIPNIDEIEEKTKNVVARINEMVFKEENILFPMLVEKLTEDEWRVISNESKEYGFLIENVPVWKSQKPAAVQYSKVKKAENGVITLPSGQFTIDQLRCMRNTLPIDITFVDKNDEVKYFSESKDRIFARTRTIIGRNVSNCHPPASVHVVEQIEEDLKSGKKDHEDFWIRRGNLFVLIRYFTVRDEHGEYLGVLEVSQDIQPIQEITGEKRLVSE